MEKNENLDIQLDVPDEFIELMSMGMMPKRDFIDALKIVTEYSKLDCHGEIKYIPIPEFTSIQQRIDEIRTDAGSQDIQEQLELFYSSCGITKDDIREIQTPFQSCTSMMQKMLIGPLEMKNYQDVFRTCVGGMSSELQQRYFEKQARNELFGEFLVTRINDGVNVVFVDRDQWPTITSVLWRNGYTQ